MGSITVTKASGKEEPFSEEKVVRSLTASGVPQDIIASAIDHLKSGLKKETSTAAIYQNITDFLRSQGYDLPLFRYSLKRAVMSLGPSGYPFEILVSDILRQQGYKTEVGVVTQGKCVSHEIDVIAEKPQEKFFIECKFHNSPGIKTDIQVALYSQARFQDIDYSQRQNGNNNNHSWLITNTKATDDVFLYGRCVGLKVTAWSLPQEENLQDLITSSHLHPITILYNIPSAKMSELLGRGVVTCSRLKTAILNHEIDDLFNKDETSSLLAKIAIICHNKNE